MTDLSRLKELKTVGDVVYRLGNEIDVAQMIEVYVASTLGERRPVDDRERMATMLRSSNLVVTAWNREQLLGMARSVSDFALTTYLSDLAVRKSHQSLGIGKELIRLTRELGGPQTKILLLAAPASVGYYPKIGFNNHPQAWVLRPEDELK